MALQIPTSFVSHYWIYVILSQASTELTHFEISRFMGKFYSAWIAFILLLLTYGPIGTVCGSRYLHPRRRHCLWHRGSAMHVSVGYALKPWHGHSSRQPWLYKPPLLPGMYQAEVLHHLHCTCIHLGVVRGNHHPRIACHLLLQEEHYLRSGL